MPKVGQRIRIEMLDDPCCQNYVGKEGEITLIEKDPWGDTRMEGTWGSIAIYPSVDKFSIIQG